jgi:hypothetical protein
MDHEGHSLSFGPFAFMASPAEALRPLSVIVFAVLTFSAAAGWRQGIRARILLALCQSVFASLIIGGVVKEAFGGLGQKAGSVTIRPGFAMAHSGSSRFTKALDGTPFHSATRRSLRRLRPSSGWSGPN